MGPGRRKVSPVEGFVLDGGDSDALRQILEDEGIPIRSAASRRLRGQGRAALRITLWIMAVVAAVWAVWWWTRQ